jgi:hypothetical protein
VRNRRTNWYLLANLSLSIRVPIWIASESQTANPRSLHRLRCDVQNIIARTDGPGFWRELGPCEIQSPCMYQCMYSTVAGCRWQG